MQPRGIMQAFGMKVEAEAEVEGCAIHPQDVR
jgi:hypothetical protein